jgi:hypothetical protein
MPEYDMIGELNESGVINLDTVNRGAATITAGKNQGFIQVNRVSRMSAHSC